MKSLALLGLLLGLATPRQTPESVPVIPLKPDPPFAIDGDLRDWAGVPGELTVTGKEHATYNPSTWKGPGDLGAGTHLAWRNEGLYLGMDITDDVLIKTQRDEKLYQGDHVEVFLDFTPDAEPQRTSFGAGQFQFAFSPGNFRQTGDPLVDIKPEVYCYQPKGGSCAGIKYAAVKTARGWILEAIIPAALMKVNLAQNLPVGVEVALSDCDSQEPAQETFYTIGTGPWQYGRDMLGLFVLGDVAGKGSPPPRSVPIAGEIVIKPGEEQAIALPNVEIPKGKDAFLFFKARVVYSEPGGYNPALRVWLDQTGLGADRVTNRPPQSTRNEGTVHTFITPEGIIYVPYGPDFTASDSNPYYGLQGGVKVHEWEFRVTDLLQAGAKQLRLHSYTDGNVKLDLVLGQVELRLKAPPPPPPPKRKAPTGPLPAIVPRTVFKTAYNAREIGPGAIRVAVPGETYTVESRFSTPDGKWVSASGKYFAHQRRIELKPEWVLVRDTFRNLMADNLPLMQRHTCGLKGRGKRYWCAGISPASGEIVVSDPQNPTSFAVTGKSGLGLMPWNDEFQVHVTNSAVGGVLGLADQSLVLPPGKTYTAEWFILPVARPDFWDFVNVARRARGANFRLWMQSGWTSTRPEVEAWSDETVKAFVRNRGLNVAGTGIEYPTYKGMYAHGTVFQGLDHSSHARTHERWRRLCPGLKFSTYFHCFLDVGEDAAEKYADARVLLASGQQANYGEPYDRIFFPTLTNTFGRDIAKNVDTIFDDCKADGVYWDEMDYSAYKYHYGEPWDGYSGDIDPQTGKLVRLKSSVTLLSQPFRRQLAEKIIKRGFLQANGAPHTRTMADLHYQCFVETAAISNCLRAILYSPVALGDHISERNGLDCYRWMLGALDYGCLYNWYDYRVQVSYPTLGSYMFPTTPLELHQGYIIGKERIVTKLSGLYGWGDKSRHEVHVFDAEGREVPGFKAATVTRNGKTYTELRIAEDWSAAIIRK